MTPRPIELESRLLNEMRRMLQGAESDKATIKQAAEIVREAEIIMTSVAASGVEKQTTGAKAEGVGPYI